MADVFPAHKETFFHLIKFCPGTITIRNFFSTFFQIGELNPLTTDELCIGTDNFANMKSMLCNVAIVFFLRFRSRSRHSNPESQQNECKTNIIKVRKN